jgi:ornithine cyclodeaminase
MLMLDAAQIERVLDFPALIDALREAFRGDGTVPLRQHLTVPVPGGSDGTLLLMPAWTPARHVGVKIVTVFPDNADLGLPSVYGSYLLLSARTGEPLAMLDGRSLTVRRTAAASALAAGYLAREDARHLVMVGTGALAPNLIAAHAAVRRFDRISLWGRNPERAAALAHRLAGLGLPVRPVADLRAAVDGADIVSCATLSREPLVLGDWLRPGTHLDLVGGFTPAMREADDTAVRRSEVYVDTRAGATHEAGDIVQPLERGVLAAESIRGDLFDLARGTVPGRRTAGEITLFKSVGTALEDLAAAELAYERTLR